MSERVERLIKTAVIAAAEYEADYLSSLPSCEVEISEVTEKNILSYANKKPRARIAPRRMIAILIAAALFLALSITAYAFREQIGNFFVSVFDDHTKMDVPDVIIDGVETVYQPMYIPQGYVKSYEKQTASMRLFSWEMGDARIDFSQSTMRGGHVLVDTEGAELMEIYVDDQLIFLVNKYQLYYAVWEDGVYSYYLSCPEELGQAEFEKIIRSIAPIEG